MWERCQTCPTRNLPQKQQKYVVPGRGNEDADTAFVGEGPGREENNKHYCFAGKTGDELGGTYLPLSSHNFNDSYFTNAFKCHWADSSDAPPDAVIRGCAEFHLRRELEQVRPKLVVLMGGPANRLAGINVELHHGFITPGVRLLGHKCDVFSTNHPALGLHKSSAMLNLLEDFRALRDRRKLPVDKYPNLKCKRLTTAREVKAELGNFYDEDLAVDTESIKRWRGFISTIRYTTWCATWSREPGYAFMVRVEDTGAWEEFGRQTKRFRRVIMHNSDHDMERLREAGIVLDWGCNQDTMQLAYHDGRLPKGLKALGYRLLGSKMRSFEEVVAPYGFERQIEYLSEAIAQDWPDKVQKGTGQMVWKVCADCKGNGVLTVGRGKLSRQYRCDCKAGKVLVERMERKHGARQNLSLLISGIKKNPDGIDIQDRWENWDPENVELIMRVMGAPLPLPSIDFVPEDEALEYACCDAHNTLRIAPILRARVAEIRRKVRIAA